MANDRSLYTLGFHLASRNCVILVLTFFADTEYISPAARGQKVEVEYVQTFIAVS